MIKEAVVLAGGFGTRLRSAVPDLPKAMAPVNGQPFLCYIINYLRLQGIERFVFSLGYKSESIETWLKQYYPAMEYKTVVEREPLGTGGGLQLALRKCTTPHVLAANGDTLFRIKVPGLEQVHTAHHSECTLALKPMQPITRYGMVELGADQVIRSFKEKGVYEQGLINGGIYLINREKFQKRRLPEAFSFEKDYLERFCSEKVFFGSIQEEYFIDIGIPEDYQAAQKHFQKPMLDLSKVDRQWTLFLDRDGVLNDEQLGRYVLSWDAFRFSEGVLQAFPILAQKFGRIVIITNQRGVGKALMTEDHLHHIHREMQQQIAAAGAHIDKVYYCTATENTCFNRKPNPGMAVQAFLDFPDIDPQKTIMVGNKHSDMQFGRAAGVYTVFVTTTNPNEPHPHSDIDMRFSNLLAFAEALQS
jgi:D-glycero-alpha-D-manno-heptose 1-phosphate guanylyltransferase